MTPQSNSDNDSYMMIVFYAIFWGVAVYNIMYIHTVPYAFKIWWRACFGLMMSLPFWCRNQTSRKQTVCYVCLKGVSGPWDVLTARSVLPEWPPNVLSEGLETIFRYRRIALIFVVGGFYDDQALDCSRTKRRTCFKVCTPLFNIIQNHWTQKYPDLRSQGTFGNWFLLSGLPQLPL